MTGTDLAILLRTRLGQTYRLGARADLSDRTWGFAPRQEWDCAELASWGVFQLTRRFFGCLNGDPYSGAWSDQAAALPILVAGVGDRPGGYRVPIEIACATVGAVLVRTPQPGHVGHVAVSIGEGRTVEAYDSDRGVIEGRSLGRRWDHGVLVPWLAYDVRSGPIVAAPSVLRIGSRGDLVRRLQAALRLEVDGIYGPNTAHAVAAYQRSRHLVPDGEAGRITLGALGLV